jgi:hypothetical protein
MNIPAIVASVVGTAWTVFDSVAVAAVYHRVTPAAYDPEAGDSPSVETTHPVKVLFGVFEHEEVDNKIVQSGDEKLLVRTTELALEPTKDDYLVKADGTRYDVELIRIEPTRNVWVLRGRASRK